MKIAIQGIAGSFHEEAARRLLGNEPFELVSYATFTKVFEAVANGDVDYGVSAIENNLHGSINEVYRLLERHNLWITAEIRMRIEQCLIGPRAVTLEELAKNGEAVHVSSQAPALAQVEQWLDANLPEAIREETHDTAESVQHVMEQGDPLKLAVAGKHAAELYGATVIAQHINDDPDNYTRFVLLIREHRSSPETTASSYILRTDHTPGALVRALQVFGEADINLTKLDSHPIPGDKQHYAFYIDADASFESPTMQKVIPELELQGCTVRTLGSYVRL